MESFPKNEDENRKSFDRYIELFHLTKEDLTKSLLDVGSGRGEFIHFLRHELGNTHAFGVEKNATKISPQEEGMVIADGFRLPFTDESFELVLAKNYLPMFVGDEDEMQEALQELLRVTIHGGRIIGDISVPERVEEDMEEYKSLEGYNEGTENWFKERYKSAKKLMLFLDELQKKGIVVQREGEVVTIHKN